MSERDTEFRRVLAFSESERVFYACVSVEEVCMCVQHRVWTCLCAFYVVYNLKTAERERERERWMMYF